MVEADNHWRLADDLYDSCVADIYSAAAGAIPWTQVCNTISNAFDLFGVHIIGVEKQIGRLMFSWEGGKISPECFADYILKYHPENPRIKFAMALVGDDWVHDHVHFDDDFIEDNKFFQDFAIPYGVRHLSGTKLVDDDTHAVMFGAIRSPNQKPMNEAELEGLKRLRRHLVNLVEIYLSLRSAFDEMSAGQALLDALPQAAYLIDSARTICHLNRAAKEQSTSGEIVSKNERIFLINDARADACLTMKLRALEQGALSSENTKESRWSIPIGSPIPSALAIGIIVRPDPMMQAFSKDTRILVLVHQLGQGALDDPFLIGQIFDLTPAEAMIAVELVKGETPQRIATTRCVALSTVRSQIRKIYEKTHVNRQVELTRLLAGIPNLQSELPIKLASSKSSFNQAGFAPR